MSFYLRETCRIFNFLANCCDYARKQYKAPISFSPEVYETSSKTGSRIRILYLLTGPNAAVCLPPYGTLYTLTFDYARHSYVQMTFDGLSVHSWSICTSPTPHISGQYSIIQMFVFYLSAILRSHQMADDICCMYVLIALIDYCGQLVQIQF